MGKQFRFIMDETDEREFFEYIKHDGRIFETKKSEGTLEISEFPNYIYLKLYLSKDEFGELEFKENLDGKKYINTTVSPVIELRKTILRENIKEIQRGRLFVEMKYYNDNDEIQQKNGLVDVWYKELIRWIKRRLYCVEVILNGKVTKEYVSESLIAFVEDGFHLLG